MPVGIKIVRKQKANIIVPKNIDDKTWRKIGEIVAAGVIQNIIDRKIGPARNQPSTIKRKRDDAASGKPGAELAAMLAPLRHLRGSFTRPVGKGGSFRIKVKKRSVVVYPAKFIVPPGKVKRRGSWVRGKGKGIKFDELVDILQRRGYRRWFSVSKKAQGLIDRLVAAQLRQQIRREAFKARGK